MAEKGPDDKQFSRRDFLKTTGVATGGIIGGSLLGGLMSLSNLYIGLKTGWALGISITACILAYSLNKIFRMHMSILENNCMQSTASSAVSGRRTPVTGQRR